MKRKIVKIKIKRKFKTSNFERGKSFELRVRNRFLKAGWGYAKRKWGSLGDEDVVCIKKDGIGYGSLVALPQCKFGWFAMQQYKEKDKQKLRDLANSCGAIPIYAYSLRRKMHLIDLNTGREFIP